MAIQRRMHLQEWLVQRRMRFYRCDGNPEKDTNAIMTAVHRRMTACRCDGNPEKDAPARMTAVQRRMSASRCDDSPRRMHLQEWLQSSEGCQPVGVMTVQEGCTYKNDCSPEKDDILQVWRQSRKDAPTRMTAVQRRMTSYRCDGSPGRMYLQECLHSREGCHPIDMMAVQEGCTYKNDCSPEKDDIL